MQRYKNKKTEFELKNSKKDPKLIYLLKKNKQIDESILQIKLRRQQNTFKKTIQKLKTLKNNNNLEEDMDYNF